MSQIKIRMSTEEVASFLKKYYGGEVKNVLVVEEGEISRVFFYQYAGQDYVIRFNRRGEGYQKELHLSKTLSRKGILMPKILEVDQANEIFFSISERVAGVTIATLAEQRLQKLLPTLIRALVELHHVNIEESVGYGFIDRSGDASFNDLTLFFESFFDQRNPNFWTGWHHLYEESFLEREIMEKLYSKMMKLLSYSKDKRYLVHGDFHLGNIIADREELTAIIDWEMAMYGDFMFDVATIHMWHAQLRFPELIYTYLERHGKGVQHFEQRLNAYTLCKGIDALRFFALKGDKQAYLNTKEYLLSLL